jgi:amidase
MSSGKQVPGADRSTAQSLNAYSSAADMAGLLRQRQCSARELLEAHLRRIERLDGSLNSIVVKDFERARRDADAADQRLARGETSPWLGVPITVKESVDVEGLPSTAGVLHRRGHVAGRDALTVARLRAAGGVVLGKTNVCTWLADFNADNPVYGRTNSPFDLRRTPGGSSGGSATLAAGLCAMDLGSDLGGSLRVPAAFCGLYGHRPSESAVPNSGNFPGSTLPNAGIVMPIQGPQARHAIDLELALDTIGGADVGMNAGWVLQIPPSRHEQLRDFRIAMLPPVPWLEVDVEIAAALQQLADQLVRLGVHVRAVAPPGVDLAESYAAFRTMMGVIVSSRWPEELRATVAAKKVASGEQFQIAEARGLRATSGEYIILHEQREILRAAWRDFFRNFDLLLTPATLCVAFEHTTVPTSERRLHINGKDLEFDYLSFYTGLSNFPGQPATAFPAGRNKAGLPIGLQAIGPFLEDRTPIRFAQMLAAEFGGFAPPVGYDAELTQVTHRFT